MVAHRRLGYLLCTVYVIGGIIGNPIFTSTPKLVLEKVQCIYLATAAWVAAGLLCLSGARSLVKLSLLVPHAGGPIYYLKLAYGDVAGFTFVWLRNCFLVPTNQAIACVVLSRFLIAPFKGHSHHDCDETEREKTAVRVIGILALWLIHFANTFDLFVARFIMFISSFIKLFALCLMVYAGLQTKNFKHSVGEVTCSFDTTDFVAAVHLAYFAFNGWDVLNYILDEVSDYTATIGRAIYTGLLVTLLMYILVNIAFYLALGQEEMLATPTIAIDFVNKIAPKQTIFANIAVSMAAVGILNRIVVVSSLTWYHAAKLDYFPSALSLVSPESGIPIPAVALSTIFGSFLIFFFETPTLITLNVNSSLLLQMLIVSALITFRFSDNANIDSMSIKLFGPVFFMLTAATVFAVGTLHHPRETIAGVVWIALAPLVHTFFVQPKRRPLWATNLSAKFSAVCQRFFLCVKETEVNIVRSRAPTKKT